MKDELLSAGGYQDGIGFRHAAIVELANKYGLKLEYAQKFFKTNEEKQRGLEIIENNLRHGQPVIASIINELNPVRSSHLVTIRGFRKNEREVEGYLVQDSDGRWRGHSYFLSRQEFLSCWRGGLIFGKQVRASNFAGIMVRFLRKLGA
ncbi:MAG TPA: C39 family peptidase [Candidatus Paceibacterota bacterium]|nr:C39 family peptidase [Candidatus Paceibacterota bacterium]